MKKMLWLGGSVLLSLGLFFCLRPTDHLDTKSYVQSTSPTLFFHGYGSSSRAEHHMTGAARAAGVTQTIIEARVDKAGQVSLKGDLPKGAINPIIEVSYEDNRNPDYARDAQYAKNVISKLQQTYGFKTMNLVGHSMGNMSILFYILENASDENLPQIQKIVHLANHVNGLEDMDLPENLTLEADTGKPSGMSPAYEKLLGLKEIFPQDQVKILNIYGDIGGETDGSVLNISSLSLKYLVAEHAKSYQEIKITGPKAQHSQLHENEEVDQILIAFLWK